MEKKSRYSRQDKKKTKRKQKEKKGKLEGIKKQNNYTAEQIKKYQIP